MMINLLRGFSINSLKYPLCKSKEIFTLNSRYLSNEDESKSNGDSPNKDVIIVDNEMGIKDNLKPRVTRFGFHGVNSTWKYSRGGIRNFNDTLSPPSSSDIVKLPTLAINSHIFPGFQRLIIKDDYIQNLIKNIPPRLPRIGLFTIKEGEKFDPLKAKDFSQLYSIGTLASYHTWPTGSKDSSYIVLQSHKRLHRLVNDIPDDLDIKKNPLFSECLRLKDNNIETTPEVKALCYQIIGLIRRLQPFFTMNSAAEELGKKILNPLYWSYSACDFTMPFTSSRLQSILEENDIVQRLKLTSQVLVEELEFINLANQMNQRAQELDKRVNHLTNLTRMRSIIDNSINQFTHSDESNPADSSVKFATGFNPKPKAETFDKKIRNRLKNLILPPEVALVVEDELERLASMDKHSSETSTIQSYLDQITLIPWGIFHSNTDIDLSRALEILNEDHYGLEDVKNTIIEHLAVMSRVAKAKGRILCLVGPPGVGKTSVVKSIARALNRDYVRLCVGGIDEFSEIKGHRRTFVASLPGKIVKCLQLAKSMDPVFCVDEVDKLSRSNRGDPASALLEVFDPEQNNKFIDHYIDLPCDLSRVFFICTANRKENIPPPLLNRMEVINLSGYTCDEKLEIVNNYVIPSIIKDFDMKDLYSSRISIDQEVIKKLTNEYFLESGIRDTKKCIETIFRKCLKEISINNPEKININLNNITHYAGYPMNAIRKSNPNNTEIGIVTGLSAVEYYATGFLLTIECDFVKKDKSESKNLSVTGLAGQTLSESSTIAYIVAKKMVNSLFPANTALDENNVRIHFLDGGTKKDGPSAGVGIFCAVVSQTLKIPVSSDIAMTGEISLKGKVMAIGGVKEKVTAAIRSEINNIMLPEENRPDFEKLNISIRSKINVHFVNNVKEVMKIVFPSLNEVAVNNEINISHEKVQNDSF